jgi:hypothetical protein
LSKEPLKILAGGDNMDSVDDRNYRWFRKNLMSLMQENKGKFLVIYDESMRGSYATFKEALDEALKIAKPGDFLVQHCVEDAEEANANVFCSLLRLPKLT